jgi:hydrogenase nickel incorporation protein HypA/HybF
MHELAICQGLMHEVERAATANQARRVTRIVLTVGALAGVEPELLLQAFTIARAGSIAGTAELVIETIPPRVACHSCGAETEASVNRLVCAACGDWQVRVIAGDELLLRSLDIESADTNINEASEGDGPCAQPAAAR